MWWTEERIDFYKKAAAASTFHSDLVSLLQPYMPKDESIAELGCGLGWMTAALQKKGYTVTGYDIDTLAIDQAKRTFPSCNYILHDCYDLYSVADTSICLFFGRITKGTNFSSLMESCKKRLIYIQNEHQDWSRCDWKRSDEVESFLQGHSVPYGVERSHLRFDQPLDSPEDFERYIKAYYTSRRPFDRSFDGKAVIIDKAFSLFIIPKEET